jgi:hypothetical protein
LHAERYVLSGSTNTHMDDGLHTVFVDSKNGRIVLQTLPSLGIIGITAVIRNPSLSFPESTGSNIDQWTSND